MDRPVYIMEATQVPLSERENYLRNASMTGPEWIPAHVVFSNAIRADLREELDEICARHPILFPDFKKGEIDYDNLPFRPGRRAGEPCRDSWGCLWETAISGLMGVVTEHPLDDWDKLDDYQPPDPLVLGEFEPVDWDAIRQAIARAKAEGRLTQGHLAHGFFFMRLFYLRGFTSLMMDIATEDARLPRLIDMLVNYNREIVNQWLTVGVDVLTAGDDMGTQTASFISPADFHKWVTPAYKAIFQPVREAGAHVMLHSDGHVLELVDEFIESGVTIVNIQDLCHGIDDLVREIKGRVCLRLDIDRQSVVPHGTPKDIHDLIEEEVRKLGSPEGGLEFLVGFYPPTPPENIEAICSAIEEFRTYWWR